MINWAEETFVEVDKFMDGIGFMTNQHHVVGFKSVNKTIEMYFILTNVYAKPFTVDRNIIVEVLRGIGIDAPVIGETTHSVGRHGCSSMCSFKDPDGKMYALITAAAEEMDRNNWGWNVKRNESDVVTEPFVFDKVVDVSKPHDNSYVIKADTGCQMHVRVTEQGLIFVGEYSADGTYKAVSIPTWVIITVLGKLYVKFSSMNSLQYDTYGRLVSPDAQSKKFNQHVLAQLEKQYVKFSGKSLTAGQKSLQTYRQAQRTNSPFAALKALQ